jgi:2-(1,2-epoxy-1,2-dihydrophenyl)acetyl-CoA isomerase
MSSPSSSLILERGDGVLQITLNRPDVLNSFTREMAQALRQVLAEAATDDAVRAVVLTGAGRGFCAGQDLAEALPEGDGPMPDIGEIVKTCYNPIIRAIRALEKPVLCAVNGIAAGAGANLAFACDLTIAADDANFVESFAKLGLIPDTSGTFFVPRLVGLQRATGMFFLAGVDLGCRTQGGADDYCLGDGAAVGHPGHAWVRPDEAGAQRELRQRPRCPARCGSTGDARGRAHR